MMIANQTSIILYSENGRDIGLIIKEAEADGGIGED